VFPNGEAAGLVSALVGAAPNVEPVGLVSVGFAPKAPLNSPLPPGTGAAGVELAAVEDAGAATGHINVSSSVGGFNPIFMEL
jgi:hypothetical protein